MISFSLKSLPIKTWALPFNLKQRDKLALMAAGVALSLFIVVQLILFPILDRRTRLRRQIGAQVQALAEMNQLKSEYQQLTLRTHKNEALIKARPPGFTLFSFLDALAGQTGIKQNIAYMKPSTASLKNSSASLSIVEMKISSLTMEQMVNFIHGIEASPNLIWVKRISIAKDEKEVDLLNLVLQVETYQ